MVIRLQRAKESDNYTVFQTDTTAVGRGRNGAPKQQPVVAGSAVYVHKAVGDADAIVILDIDQYNRLLTQATHNER